METYYGQSILNKITIGTLQLYKRKEISIKHKYTTDIDYELERFHEAVDTAKVQLEELYHQTKKELGETEANLFLSHNMILEDEEFLGKVSANIQIENMTVAYGVLQAKKYFVDIFQSLEDEYIRERSNDIEDVSERLISILLPTKHSQNLSEYGVHIIGDKPVILLADDLTPSETAQMNKELLLGFVTLKGSKYSHTAILAKTMNVPALMGISISSKWDGKTAIIDGREGKLLIEPTEEILQKYMRMLEEEHELSEKRRNLIGKETKSIDGHRIALHANVGSIFDVKHVIENDGEGIGLFRSEFLYLESKDYPSEEEQFKVYKEAVEAMNGKRVVIRTLDLGSDKKVNYFQLGEEENPALGYRGIRICLDRISIFKTQLRAILRASNYGTVAIMFPMIASAFEIEEAKAILEECKQEFMAEKTPFKEIEIGIMIETPAAVIVADELAPLVDFFSIGTNDLTQYTLAVDRQNPALEKHYDGRHKAILRMIEHVVKTAHANHVWTGICGELGADISLTKFFLEIGVDELSVVPSAILPLREHICNIELETK